MVIVICFACSSVTIMHCLCCFRLSWWMGPATSSAAWGPWWPRPSSMEIRLSSSDVKTSTSLGHSSGRLLSTVM